MDSCEKKKFLDIERKTTNYCKYKYAYKELLSLDETELEI